MKPTLKKASSHNERLQVETISDFSMSCSANTTTYCYGDDSEPHIYDESNEAAVLKAAYKDGWRTIESSKTLMQACPACIEDYKRYLKTGEIEDLTIYIEYELRNIEEFFTD